jgi:uncharacterized protein (TIGR00369 family)
MVSVPSVPSAWLAMSKVGDVHEVADNPTRAFIADAIGAGRRDVVLDVNPAFASLSTVLEEGEPGRVAMRFVAPEWAAQGNGVVGGGTLANMLDCGLAVATLSSLSAGQSCTTISLTVNMLRSASIGPLFVQATVDRLGRRIAFAHAQLFDPERRLVATASSSLAII